jgi:hypothetical protein
MSPHNRRLALGLALLAAVSPAGAQKKLTVKLTHPAAFGHVLAGKRVIVGPVTGDCSKEFADLLAADLAGHGVLAAESDGLPSVRLTADISRCDARRREPLVGSGLPAPHISRVEGRFQSEVRAVDPAGGKELAACTLRAEAQKENRSEGGVPEYPAQSDVKEMTLAKAVAEARRLYLPWTEVRDLPFMDDEECSLKEAFALVNAGDYAGALRVSRTSAGTCQASPKIAAGAWYNFGVVLMLQRNYDDALSAFGEAQKRNSRKFVAEIIGACRKDKALADAAKSVQASAAAMPAGPAETGIVLTNDFILKMVRANVAEEEIVKMIAAQPARFALGPEDLRQLREAGAPEAVITAMLDKK